MIKPPAGNDVREWGKFYHHLGLSPLWLKPGCKFPFENGWNKNPRDELVVFLDKYCQGYGVGIRTGVALPEDQFLFVIDVDLRSNDPRYRREAIESIERMAPGMFQSAPFVESGGGHGSCHLYGIAPAAHHSQKIGKSHDFVKVYSPSSPPQMARIKPGELTKEEHQQGWRMKAAWETELFGVGKQVVAPPTRHPDTNKSYTWGRPLWT